MKQTVFKRPGFLITFTGKRQIN